MTVNRISSPTRSTVKDLMVRTVDFFIFLLAQKAEGVNGYVLDTTAGTYTDNKGITYKYVLADPEKTIETNDGHLTPDDPSDDYAKVYYLTDEADVPAMFIKHSLGELAGNDANL